MSQRPSPSPAQPTRRRGRPAVRGAVVTAAALLCIGAGSGLSAAAAPSTGAGDGLAPGAAAGGPGLYAVVRPPAEQSLDASGSSASLVDAVVDRALEATGRTGVADVAATGQLLQVDVMRAGAGDAYGVASVTAVPGSHGTGEGWFFLAVAEDASWRVELEHDRGFSGLAETSTVLTAQERRLLSRYATATPRLEQTDAGALALTGLMLPWQKGSSWAYIGGPHGFAALPDEPRSSLDLSAGGGGRVLASGKGVAAAMCASGGYRGWVRIVHPNGLSTDYYHLIDNVTPDGDPVRRGAFLGVEGTDVSCGGSALGPHVHYTLGNRTLGGGGDFIAIEGHKIGGWTFWNGAEQYEGSATHGATTVGVGELIKNYGSRGGGGGQDPPTRAEVWSDGERVNLRAGPGTDYEIVGSKADGDVIKIDCTARGTWVEGMDGPTNLWDRLTSGKWISDGFVYTGTGEPVEEPC